MLLCVGCNGEEYPQDTSSVMTRIGISDIHLTLSGRTMSISWNKPFGNAMGISVEVYDQSSSGGSLGSFFSKDDSGEATFSMSSYYYSYPNTLPLIAKVRQVPPSGSSNVIMDVPINNTNGSDTPTALCDHSYSPQNPFLRIELDKNLNYLNFYTNLNTSGIVVFKFLIQGRYYGIDAGPIFDSEETMGSATLYSPENSEPQAKVYLSGMNRFVNNSDVYASLEVRIYDRSCRNAYYSAGSGMFPKCTNYCKYEFSVVPLNFVNRSAAMSIIRETTPNW